jgi:hypothetical protein
MEQDTISISWKDLPWQKFQKKSFRLQCKIYKAKQSNKPRLVRRLQKLLIKSKSVYYLAVRDITETFRDKGLFVSGDKKFSLVTQSYHGIGDWRHTSFKSFSKFKNSRAFFNISFLRNKVIEYVWKFMIEPTCVNNFINLNKRWSSNLNENSINLIRFKGQMILKLVVNSHLSNISSNILMSRIWLPSKHKLGIYRAIKKCSLELYLGKDDLTSVFPNILLGGIEDLNNIPMKSSEIINYLQKFSHRYGSELVYFLRKGQNEIYLLNLVREFLESMGIDINSTTISIKKLSSAITFSRWSAIYKMGRKVLILPSSTSWSNYKKNIIRTLKRETIRTDLKIKNLKYMLLTWLKYNDCCSKVKLKSSFFYLKKLLAKYH